MLSNISVKWQKDEDGKAKPNVAVTIRCHHCSAMVPENLFAFHQQIHFHANKYRLFPCDHCTKRFSNAYKLRLHQQESHQLHKTKYCSACGGYFGRHRAFLSHKCNMLLHRPLAPINQIAEIKNSCIVSTRTETTSVKPKISVTSQNFNSDPKPGGQALRFVQLQLNTTELKNGGTSDKESGPTPSEKTIVLNPVYCSSGLKVGPALSGREIRLRTDKSDKPVLLRPVCKPKENDSKGDPDSKVTPEGVPPQPVGATIVPSKVVFEGTMPTTKKEEALHSLLRQQVLKPIVNQQERVNAVVPRVNVASKSPKFTRSIGILGKKAKKNPPVDQRSVLMKKLFAMEGSTQQQNMKTIASRLSKRPFLKTRTTPSPPQSPAEGTMDNSVIADVREMQKLIRETGTKTTGLPIMPAQMYRRPRKQTQSRRPRLDDEVEGPIRRAESILSMIGTSTVLSLGFFRKAEEEENRDKGQGQGQGQGQEEMVNRTMAEAERDDMIDAMDLGEYVDEVLAN